MKRSIHNYKIKNVYARIMYCFCSNPFLSDIELSLCTISITHFIFKDCSYRKHQVFNNNRTEGLWHHIHWKAALKRQSYEPYATQKQRDYDDERMILRERTRVTWTKLNKLNCLRWKIMRRCNYTRALEACDLPQGVPPGRIYWSPTAQRN